MYLAIVIAEFLAPYELHTRNIQHIYAPPQALHLFHEGEFIGPFVYGFDHKLDMETLSRVYTPNPDKVQPLRFFCGGDPYSFRSEEHTSELQSLMRISYAVFCLKKKTKLKKY